MAKVVPVETQVVAMTAELALEILKNNPINRPLRKDAVSRYRELMRAGKWHLNGETISVSVSGKLLNGQHRLHAISGLPRVTVSMVLVTGVQDEAFPTFDRGMVRSHGNVFAIRGIRNATAVAGACLIQARYQDGDEMDGQWSKRYEPEALLSILDAHPGIELACSAAGRCAHEYRISCSVLGWLLYQFRERDYDLADAFFDKLLTTASLSESNVILLLSRRLRQNAGARHRFGARDIAVLVVKAWNSFCAGIPTKQLKLSRRTMVEGSDGKSKVAEGSADSFPPILSPSQMS